MPKCKKSAATEVATTEATNLQQDAGSTAAAVTDETAVGLPSVEPVQLDLDQTAPDVIAPEPLVAPDQRTSTSASPKGLTQCSSDAYLHAVFPNLDAIIAENDFSSLDEQKR